MESELRILMLEDMEEDAGLIERALRKDNIPFTRLRVDTQKEFTEALEIFKPDVILSDHSLPQFNSTEALTICHDMKLEIPFILVTGTVSEEFAVDSLKNGADDYVLKSNLSRLPLAVRSALRYHRDENTRKEQAEVLSKQNEELIKINKELDSFVYSISHNLRSPLSSVLGLVKVAMLDQLRSPVMVDRYFSMIEQSILKLDDTLQEILNYSRNSRTQVAITKVDIKKMVQQSLAELRYQEKHHKITKQIEIQSDVPFYCDAPRLQTILTNLISNAIKYFDEAKQDSFVRISAIVTPLTATIIIRDNGIGIHADYLPDIFKMFYRATEKSEGAGLGLYIVKEMVEKLGAAIAVRSLVNEFTEITLSIPNTTP